MKDLLDFESGDKIVCVVANHGVLSPCEICEVQKVIGDKVKLKGYRVLYEKGDFRLYSKKDINDENILEFNIGGCIYTGNKEVSIDELSNEFLAFCESKGWKFCGITTPLAE
jgi:hypothetical protein